jgi:hypothetical protein
MVIYPLQRYFICALDIIVKNKGVNLHLQDKIWQMNLGLMTWTRPLTAPIYMNICTKGEVR